MDIQNLDELEVELPGEFDGLPTFAVGGVVRDTIRGAPTEDIDLMVAEVSPDEMLSRGFRRIDSPNNDTFGVFQDSLGREVAIAREEVSTGDGHRDFEIEPVPADVRASEAVHRDSQRRDFTINSLVYDVRHNVLHDPNDGVQDLHNGVIRAVNKDSFKTDSLRIIRGARFAARLEFEIDPTTKKLMSEATDKLGELPQERVRMELTKTLIQADEPSKFFHVLDDIGALQTTFPELHSLKDVPAGPSEHHQEGSAFEHTMLVLEEMKRMYPARMKVDELALLMALYHDIGKISTKGADLPSHHGHGRAGVPIIENVSNRLGMSNEQENAMKEAARYHMDFQRLNELRESTVIELSQNIDNHHLLWSLAKADARGREPIGEEPDGFARIGDASMACAQWTGERLIEEGHDPDEMGGEEFGNLLRQKRVEHMRELEQ
jgi:tRNA nucleotidyltransferase (CCA-adding enzyme)